MNGAFLEQTVTYGKAMSANRR